jgi:hypothetical protein
MTARAVMTHLRAVSKEPKLPGRPQFSPFCRRLLLSMLARGMTGSNRQVDRSSRRFHRPLF